jgi:protoheme IX farnesyltransferase
MQSLTSFVKRGGALEQPLATGQTATVRKTLNDYISLTKPRIIALLLVVTLAPMFLAGAEAPSFGLILWTMVGGFLAAGGANALNQYLDRDIDCIMGRTRLRPLPGGRMRPWQVLAFGLGLSALSFAVLWWAANLLAALLALSGILYYVLVYTLLLKRRSVQNIVVGGAAGSIPPLVGWAAVANELSLLPIFMFLIVFYWTPPHFWALALKKQQEYRAARVPMLPVIAGDHETHRQIVLYSILLLLISLAPVFLGLLGPVYLVLALILNGVFLRDALAIWRRPGAAHIWRLYRYSLLYLALLFLAMGIDHLFYTPPATLVDLHWRL